MECTLISTWLSFLLALADSRTIRATLGGVAGITWIVNANLVVRALDSRDATTSLRIWWCTLTFVVDRNSRCCCSTGVTIGLAVTTADRLEFLGATGRLGFAGALCIGNLALPDTEIAVLSCRAGQSLDGSAYSIRWGFWLIFTSGKCKSKTTAD